MSSLRGYVEAWQRGERHLAPIADLYGVVPVDLGEGTATVAMEAHARYHNAMGTVHSGVFADLADVAMGVALATVSKEGEIFVTLGLQVSYFRPVKAARLVAAARVVRRGRNTAHVECDLRADDPAGGEALVARAYSTWVFRACDVPDKTHLRGT